MKMKYIVALIAGIALSTVVAEAKGSGNGQGNGKGKGKQEQKKSCESCETAEGCTQTSAQKQACQQDQSQTKKQQKKSCSSCSE